MLLAWACAAAPPAPLRQLRFSWDGRFILAQDDSEIAVCTAHPFAIRFRIPAADATDAQLTPDSRQVVFVRYIPRVTPNRITFIASPGAVERWGVADGARAASAQIPMLGCGTVALSPDGRTLACDDFEGTLRILDVPSAEVVLEKRQFVKLIPLYSFNPIYGNEELPNGQFLGDLGQVVFDFSPDGQFLIALPSGGHGKVLAWDVRARRAVALSGGLRPLRDMTFGPNFNFIAPDRVLMSRGWFPGPLLTGRLVAFPSGKLLSKPRIPPGPIYPAANPAFFIVRPFGKHARRDNPNPRAAAFEIATGQVIISETPALDVFGRYYVAEPSPGVVGLYQRGKGLHATIALHKK